MEMIYTYRAGRRLALTKSADRFVILTRPGAASLKGLAIIEARPSAVVVRSDDVDEDMRRARAHSVAHHHYIDEAGAAFLMTDQILLSFDGFPSQAQLNAVLARHHLEVARRVSSEDFVLRLTDATGMNPLKLIVALNEARLPGIKRVEHNLEYMAAPQAAPSDGLYERQWHLHDKRLDPQVDPRASARCDEAWAALGGGGDPEVVICVLDDGCRMDHQDFDGARKFADWGYFEGDIYGYVVANKRFLHAQSAGADPHAMYSAGQNHGTACCGVIGAERDGELTIGAAYGCRLLPIKVLSHGPYLYFDDADLVEVLDFIAHKADVMSNSWGSTPTRLFSGQVIERIQRLSVSGGRRGKGILFLWAAGNENCPLSYASDKHAPYTHGWSRDESGELKWVGVETSRIFQNNLAEEDGVLHIAALASTARRAHYSNYGPGVDLCAPSSNAHAYHRMAVEGLGITTVEGDDRDDFTERFGGTSSATPLVAAIAGLIISANPDLTARQVRQILLETASQDLDLTPYPKTPPTDFDPNPAWDVSPIAPFDRGDFNEAGWSPWFGHGKVDAAAAVQRALSLRPLRG
ncbi:S8 family serine peptidase [Myxococcota bacterium]|nr:S8 family serine peptidase [Myxococcota bacterium]MBU1898242.1 S8 family serine peptidase [Myxococcota bacterium]